jgi:hypothetical protein
MMASCRKNYGTHFFQRQVGLTVHNSLDVKNYIFYIEKE